MKIEHIALYVNGLEVLSGPRTTGDGFYESCVLAVEGNQVEITVCKNKIERASWRNWKLEIFPVLPWTREK